jgi:hypothetical protein
MLSIVSPSAEITVTSHAGEHIVRCVNTLQKLLHILFRHIAFPRSRRRVGAHYVLLAWFMCSYKSLSVTLVPGNGIMQSKTSVFANMEQGWVGCV